MKLVKVGTGQRRAGGDYQEIVRKGYVLYQLKLPSKTM